MNLLWLMKHRLNMLLDQITIVIRCDNTSIHHHIRVYLLMKLLLLYVLVLLMLQIIKIVRSAIREQNSYRVIIIGRIVLYDANVVYHVIHVARVCIGYDQI